MLKAVKILGKSQFAAKIISLLENTGKYYINLILPSGNIPAYYDDKQSDKYVNFEHGATGALFLFSELYNRIIFAKLLA